MLFMIGIQQATTSKEAHSIIAPIFDDIGYGCSSASDFEEEIVQVATNAILTIVEEMMIDGFDLESLNEGYIDYSQDTRYSDFNRWIEVDIDVSCLKEKVKCSKN